MLSRIPSQLFRFYSGQGLRVAIYAYLRWRGCPFEAIESHIPREGKIIDIGCGYGLLANFLTLRSSKRDVTGIDLSVRRIRAAKETTGSRRNIRFKLMNVLDLELGELNAAVMSDFLHHIDYRAQEELLAHCYQKLPTGGLLIIEEVDDEPLCKYWFNTIVDRMLNIGKGIFFRNQREFRELLERIGFKVSVKEANKGLPLSDVIFICTK